MKTIFIFPQILFTEGTYTKQTNIGVYYKIISMGFFLKILNLELVLNFSLFVYSLLVFFDVFFYNFILAKRNIRPFLTFLCDLF